MSTSGMVFYALDKLPFSEKTSRYVEIVDASTGQLDFMDGHECELYDDMIYREYLIGNSAAMGELRVALTPYLDSQDSGIAKILRSESVERECVDDLADECERLNHHEQLRSDQWVQQFFKQLLDLCDAAKEMNNGIDVG